MLAMFCEHPLKPREVDPDFQNEFEAASRAGFNVSIINEQALLDGDVDLALRRLEETKNTTLTMYRGWMLAPETYALLCDGLIARGYNPINSPTAYQTCHCLPDSYAFIKDNTPRSTWVPNSEGLSDSNIESALGDFGRRPLVIKDYVKSQKHHWEEACYIPDASQTLPALQVIKNLIALNDGTLQGGLVLREFIELEPLGTHPQSSMPITREFRSIILNGKPIATMPYWDHGDYNVEFPPNDLIVELARNIPSRFFTLDIARSKAGKWIIIELGDAQVAGLPDNCDLDNFYQSFMTNLIG